MALFIANAHRFDPYKNFKFRVKFGDRVVAGISKVTALKKSTEPVSHREGGDPSTSRVSPSAWKFEPITLERGVTHDTEFEDWINMIHNTVEGDAAISMKNFRRDITIELLNEQGTVAKRYTVFRCWVSSYTALPDLDAKGNAIAIETIVLQNEGWERDKVTQEPTET